MNENKILELEKEIRDLHYKPVLAKHSFSETNTKEYYCEFWEYHIRPVIKYSQQMAAKYQADREIAWLGALLHDIARLDEAEPHDEIGAKKAREILLKHGFAAELAEKVSQVILTHRCRQYPPQTLEQKILATADALANFLPPFYLWVAQLADKSFADLQVGNLKKLERDYQKKIFFPDEKKLIKPQYEILKQWFTFKI